MVKTQKGIGDGMKKYKSMIILLSVFAVVLVLYFVMGKINKMQAEKDTEETIMVTDFSSLSSLEYTNGETTISFVKEDGTWKVKDNEDFNLDSDAVETIAKSLSQIEAVRVLEGADEPSAYGLDNAVYTITMETESGVTFTLYIGNETGDGYYATTNDKVVVYTIGSSAVSDMEFDLTALEAEEEEVEDTDDTADATSEETDDTVNSGNEE